jgi:hypothetical protein
MRRGREPQPTILYKLRHSYRKDRHHGRDLAAPTGVLRQIDQAILASFIIAESRMAAINLALQQQEQLLDTSEHGTAMLAALHMFQLRAQTSQERAAAQLGFSPAAVPGSRSSRTRTWAGDDRWDELAKWAEIVRLQRMLRKPAPRIGNGVDDQAPWAHRQMSKKRPIDGHFGK